MHLSSDVISEILKYLPWYEVIKLETVSKCWNEGCYKVYNSYNTVAYNKPAEIDIRLWKNDNSIHISKNSPFIIIYINRYLKEKKEEFEEELIKKLYKIPFHSLWLFDEHNNISISLLNQLGKRCKKSTIVSKCDISMLHHLPKLESIVFRSDRNHIFDWTNITTISNNYLEFLSSIFFAVPIDCPSLLRFLTCVPNLKKLGIRHICKNYAYDYLFNCNPYGENKHVNNVSVEIQPFIDLYNFPNKYKYLNIYHFDLIIWCINELKKNDTTPFILTTSNSYYSNIFKFDRSMSKDRRWENIILRSHD